ncbi:MAG: hypothetical protein JJE25_08325 [Bacteroidia bacterium]|nr:hypothetical protein [Bacteroidia bacterium]
MYSNISSALTAAQKADIQTKINDIKLVLVFLINLTPAERKKLLKMGDKSVAYVQEVLAALQANPTIVPASFDLAEFKKDMFLYNDLLEILNYLRPLFEGIDDTMLALSNELMRQANSGYGFVKEAAKTNSALESTASDLGERFKQAGKQAPTVVTLVPGGTITLNGIVPERLFKNISSATVSVFEGANAVGTKKVVGGNSSIKIPGGWTTITVVDDDAAAAIFQVIQK